MSTLITSAKICFHIALIGIISYENSKALSVGQDIVNYSFCRWIYGVHKIEEVILIIYGMFP